MRGVGCGLTGACCLPAALGPWWRSAGFRVPVVGVAAPRRQGRDSRRTRERPPGEGGLRSPGSGPPRPVLGVRGPAGAERGISATTKSPAKRLGIHSSGTRSAFRGRVEGRRARSPRAKDPGSRRAETGKKRKRGPEAQPHAQGPQKPTHTSSRQLHLAEETRLHRRCLYNPLQCVCAFWGTPYTEEEGERMGLSG